MPMARRQTLVQLSDELIALLDERAAKNGLSRSEIIRRAIERELADDIEADIDRRIIEGYTRIPPAEFDAWAEASARRSIAAEPW
jgi:metal-responsive CopG/Arc/MetJ family transcriptional regulator